MKRIQFEIREERWKALEKLMEESDTRTSKELLNNALTLLEWVVEERKAGRIIVSLNKGTGEYKELIMPFMLKGKISKDRKTEEALCSKCNKRRPFKNIRTIPSALITVKGCPVPTEIQVVGECSICGNPEIIQTKRASVITTGDITVD